MNFLRTIAVAAAGIFFSPVIAQEADYYTAPMPNNPGSFYLVHKPDSGFADIIKYDRELTPSNFTATIQNYGERTVLLDADSFTIETDRTTALYFKAKKGRREIFLKKYLNEQTCWAKGAIVYATPALKEKNTVKIYLDNSHDNDPAKCPGELLTVNTETAYADATDTQAKSELEKVALGVSVEQENKVLLIKVSREAISKFVSLNFKLYSGKKEVKDFLNIKATESVLYINDLPKGKYRYIVEVYDGTLITEGYITITKAKK